MKKPIRIVIDTNVRISYLIGQSLVNLTANIFTERVKILFRDELLAELIEVLYRPRFAKYFSSDAIQELLSLIDARGENITIRKHVKICPDKKDNFILDLCLNGKDDYLVTGDDDLLVLNPFQQTQIIDYRQFEKIFQN
jgi:putative PIN family toxin of toxin-antitoxin system